MPEAKTATRNAMEEEPKQMGASAAGSDFAEGANLDKEQEEECHSDAQGRERPSGKRRASRKPKVQRQSFATKREQRDSGPVCGRRGRGWGEKIDDVLAVLSVPASRKETVTLKG
jgi:hypothetical protein